MTTKDLLAINWTHSRNEKEAFLKSILTANESNFRNHLFNLNNLPPRFSGGHTGVNFAHTYFTAYFQMTEAVWNCLESLEPRQEFETEAYCKQRQERFWLRVGKLIGRIYCFNCYKNFADSLPVAVQLKHHENYPKP